MALNRKQIALLLMVVTLAGCGQNSERINQLEMENAKLQLKLDQREAEVKYMDDQAAIATGCDMFIEFCPSSMTQVGHAAIKQGYSGAGSSWLWLAFIGKFSALAAAFGALLIALATGRIFLLYPTQKKVRECLEIIRSAEGREAQADSNVHHANLRLIKLNEKIIIAQTELRLVEQSLQEAKQNANNQHRVYEAHQYIKQTLDDI